jgi:plastocyanin
MNDVETTGAGARARWTDLASLGFVFAGLGSLLLLVAVLGWGLNTDGEAGFFAIPVVVSVIAVILIRRRPTWAKVVGVLLALIIAFFLWWTIFGLFGGPVNFFDFVPGILVLPGALTALIAGIGALVAGRRGHVRAAPDGRERAAIRVAVIIVLVATLASGVLTATSRSTVADASAASATVVMKDFEFAPTEISVVGGSAVLARNDDPFMHTFTVDALSIDETLTIGSEKLITIPSKPGTYVLYCKPHTSDPDDPSKDDMVATLRVT